jgi:hypothetical protein
MRNKAGFMILTLLLLTVPVLANAWNLTVKVAGGDTSNYTTVTYGTATPPTVQKCVSGTFYLYPQTAAAIANVGTAAPVAYKLDGVASTLAGVNGLASGSHVVTVTYPAATPDTASSIVITQAADGGMIYSKNLNNTWSTTGLTGLKAGTLVPVSIAADFNHVIKSYTVGTATTTVNGTVAGQVIAIDATATGVTPVTAVFALAQKTTATLFAPTSITAGQVVSATITPNSNDDLALVNPYSFKLDGGAFVAQASASYSLSALTVGTHTLTGQVNTANTGSFQTPAMTIEVVTATVSANQGCVSCHSTQSPAIVTNYAASIHSQSTHSACGECHTEATPHSADINALNVDPKTFVATAAVPGKYAPVAAGAVFCTGCHNPLPHSSSLATGKTCVQCHTSANGVGGTGDAHQIQGLSCVGCHAVGQTNPFSDKTLVNDNAGVRAVTGEFTKWSHHIVNAPGVAIQDEQCAICHLEGTVGMYGFGVDGTKHMTDNKTHLRNAHTDGDLQWDPAAPDHGVMDTFCMSCHSATGADSPMSVKLQALISTGITASPLNPFGDTISNRYDKMKRPGVVNVDNQFDTANNSHHGVKGARYSGRTRLVGPRQIASAGTFANHSSQALQGIRSTIYDAGNFNALYTPLANAAGEPAPRTGAATMGDDSTLHCGDCHTVGQWKAGTAQYFVIDPATGAMSVDASKTSPVIGAHGSNNEYMLRNTLGTDARHTQNAYTSDSSNVVHYTNPNGAFLVCYNCHAYKNYGSVFVGTGADAGNAAGNPLSNIQSHAGEYASAGRCNAPGNTLSFAGYTTGKATDGSQFDSRINGLGAKAAGEQSPDFGNILGIQCLNCHNSGIGNAYGGIHGSAKNTTWNNGTTVISPNASVTGGAYIDGMGNTTKVERFLPGLGNAMHVPGTLGGFTGGTTNGGTYVTGGISNDTNWEQKHWQQTATTVINFRTAGVTNTASAGAGCYTLGEGKPLSGDVTVGLEGPSVTGIGGPATEAVGTWGGCDDHTAGQGQGNHGFLKRIIRPVTY